MINWKCIFGHKWSKWNYVETYYTLGKPDRYESKCSKCDKKKEWIGMSNIDIISGEKSPYIFQD